MADIKKEAGNKQESQVSYHLNRHFGADDRYRILQNLVLPVDGYNSHIDHLIIHRAGFILVESQSAHGRVRVNGSGEWEHSANDNWYDMPSPVMEAMSKIDALAKMLHENRMNLLDPWLPGLEQLQHFQERQFNIIVTTPSTTDFDRNDAPPETTTNTIHVESLVDRVKELTNAANVMHPTFCLESPLFTIDEMDRMTDFFSLL